MTRGSTAATYDGFGMIKSYQFDGTNTEKFLYTANDERIGVLRGTEWTWSLRDSGGRVLRQYWSSSTNTSAAWLWVEDFVYRDGLLLGGERVPEEGGRRHYHLDHLGTPRLVTGQSGSVISEHDFLPFGEERMTVAQHQGKGFDREAPHRFTGHERDFDTATPNDSSAYIDYMHARYYAAKTGRFLSIDPGKDWDPAKPQSWNMYTYTRNNPVLLVDPNGRAVASVSDGVVQNKTDDEIVWIASNSTSDGSVVVIPLEPGDSSADFVEDADAIILESDQSIGYNDQGSENTGAVFKVGPASVSVNAVGDATGPAPPGDSRLYVSAGFDIRYPLAVIGTYAVNAAPGTRDRIVPGVVSPSDAVANKWQLPQTVEARRQAYFIREQLRQQQQQKD